jgi:hypothetical protein
MRINNMLPVTLFAASLFFASALFAQTNTFKKRPNFTAHLSTGHVQFGTGDIKGYGFLLALEKSILKKSVRPFPVLQIGFALNFETGLRKPINIVHPNGDIELSSFGQTTKTSGWATFKYHPFKYSMDGFSITVGPTFGVTQAVSESRVILFSDPYLGVIRHSILATDHFFAIGYRVAVQQEFMIRDKYFVGIRADFSNDTHSDANTFAGCSIGYKF